MADLVLRRCYRILSRALFLFLTPFALAPLLTAADAIDAPPAGLVDPAFLADLPHAPRNIVPLPDGRVLVYYSPTQDSAPGDDITGRALVGDEVLRRLMPDGAFDSSFTPAFASGDILVQPDGRLLLFNRTASTHADALVRLTESGERDRSFQLADRIDLTRGRPLLLADGKLAWINIGLAAQITRLNPDGSLDESFTPFSLDLASPFPAGFVNWSYRSYSNAVDDEGRIYIAAYNLPTGRMDQPASCVFRLHADATLDASFSPRALTIPLYRLWWAAGRLYYFTGLNTYAGVPTAAAYSFGRLSSDGSVDDTYPTFAFSNHPPTPTPQLPLGAFDAVGHLLLTSGGPNDSLTGSTAALTRGLVRYNADGQRDAAFSARLDQVEPALTQLVPLADGSVLAAGSFTALNGVATHGLARLQPITDAYATRLTNLSLRALSGPGEQTLIAGFIVTGTTGTRSVLVRGVGPGLTSFGLAASSVHPDPRLTLYRRSDDIAANDDWDAALAGMAATLGAFPLAAGSKDAALLVTVAPEEYTVHIPAASDDPRLALLEVYDADAAPADATAARLANISGRADVRGGDRIVVAGFVVSGSHPLRVLVRGVGPGLSPFGIVNALADPQLRLFRAAASGEAQLIATNDNWSGDPALKAAFTAVGAGALPDDSTDAALLATLEPGVYTAQLSGVNATTGVGLLEIYEVR